MFRSLFVRLIVTYFFIILITLATLGVLLGEMYKRDYLADTRKTLQNEMTEINKLGEQNTLGLIEDQDFYYDLAVIARQLKATIWIVDRFGYMWRVADPNQNTQWEGQQFSKEEFSQYLKQVLDGHSIEISGNFGKRFQTPVLTLGGPFIVRNKIIGAIFIHTQLQQIQKAYHNLYNQIWRAAIISGILAIVLISWISVRLSNPLIQMNAIALEVAKGNFDKRVNVKSKDEIGQLATSFNAMIKELKSLEELRRSFVANVSHELRSPLTSMQGFVQGMVDGTISIEDHDQYLHIVLDETKRLNKLITELLNLAQIESGKFPLHMEVFDINELIRRVLIKYEGKIDTKKLDVEVIFREEQYFVEADKDRIEQVISNILDNAIKFSYKDGKLAVWSHASKDKIYVSIRDSGPGIKEDDIPYVWERFYKVDKAHTSEVEGTGLGLSIVKKIIDQHNQKIWVKSQEGKGTVFIFSLKKGQSEKM